MLTAALALATTLLFVALSMAGTLFNVVYHDERVEELIHEDAVPAWYERLSLLFMLPGVYVLLAIVIWGGHEEKPKEGWLAPLKDILKAAFRRSAPTDTTLF